MVRFTGAMIILLGVVGCSASEAMADTDYKQIGKEASIALDDCMEGAVIGTYNKIFVLCRDIVARDFALKGTGMDRVRRGVTINGENE